MISQLASSAIATFLALFPFTNPLGVVPIFYSLTAYETPRTRRYQARQVALNAIAILVLFFLAGRLILDWLGISLGVLQVAGGLLVARTAWDLGNRHSPSLAEVAGESSFNQDISLIPMAIPIISGPGAIGMAIALAAQNSHGAGYVGSLLGMGLLGLTLYLCLCLGEPIIRVLGRRGLKAVNQVLSFFILALAIQLIFNGTLTLLQDPSLTKLLRI
jgi:multiple antibiotic resistance protein